MKDFKSEGLKMLLDASQDLNREYEKELRKLKRSNLKIKLDMQVLVSHPDSRASEIIRNNHKGELTFSESLLHYN
jgi:hypothetical protein